ncbi:hypothetical protein OB236_09450 [Paenibacillus sp. WQ 127069]|uniref:Uncharacterized protein n=1 Tax=Paenibacillus baimaensis TaxID=2982185 RepID=A0ABT2UCN7_9BACL|nr:hypothetical protein [Paenibacillus sp. WQ 127069]MCU6792352.1 hypothetical protein [Paenibacillus sp. WQ 127069]
MFIISASKEKSRWVSGIFKEEENALQFINSIPEDLKEYQQLIKLENLEYPFYIKEKNGFEFVNKDEVIRIFDDIEVSQDEKIVYFNIYTIKTDYQPKKPGTDYMGILSHDHITNDFLEWYKKEGIDFLIRRGIF